MSDLVPKEAWLAAGFPEAPTRGMVYVEDVYHLAPHIIAAELERLATALESTRGLGGSGFQYDHGLLSIEATAKWLRSIRASELRGEVSSP